MLPLSPDCDAVSVGVDDSESAAARGRALLGGVQQERPAVHPLSAPSTKKRCQWTRRDTVSPACLGTRSRSHASGTLREPPHAGTSACARYGAGRGHTALTAPPARSPAAAQTPAQRAHTVTRQGVREHSHAALLRGLRVRKETQEQQQPEEAAGEARTASPPGDSRGGQPSVPGAGDTGRPSQDGTVWHQEGAGGGRRRCRDEASGAGPVTW